MAKQNSLCDLIRIISGSTDNVEREIAYERFYNRIKGHFTKGLMSLCYRHHVNPNTEIPETVFGLTMTEFYLSVRNRKFDAERFTNDEELHKVIMKWLLTIAEWRLCDELKEHITRKRNITFASEFTDILGSDEDDRADSIMNRWHELIGGVTEVEAKMYVRNLIARIEHAFLFMCDKYVAILKLHLLRDQKPMKPTIDEKEKLMKEFYIKTDKDYNTAKSRALEQLRNLLDNDPE